MPPLPSDRLLQAGATREELAQLEAEQEALSTPEQEGRVAHFESIAVGDIAEWLDGQRKGGRFTADEPEAEPAEAEPRSTSRTRTTQAESTD